MICLLESLQALDQRIESAQAHVRYLEDLRLEIHSLHALDLAESLPTPGEESSASTGNQFSVETYEPNTTGCDQDLTPCRVSCPRGPIGLLKEFIETVVVLW